MSRGSRRTAVNVSVSLRGTGWGLVLVRGMFSQAAAVAVCPRRTERAAVDDDNDDDDAQGEHNDELITRDPQPWAINNARRTVGRRQRATAGALNGARSANTRADTYSYCVREPHTRSWLARTLSNGRRFFRTLNSRAIIIASLLCCEACGGGWGWGGRQGWFWEAKSYGRAYQRSTGQSFWVFFFTTDDRPPLEKQMNLYENLYENYVILFNADSRIRLKTNTFHSTPNKTKHFISRTFTYSGVNEYI